MKFIHSKYGVVFRTSSMYWKKLSMHLFFVINFVLIPVYGHSGNEPLNIDFVKDNIENIEVLFDKGRDYEIGNLPNQKFQKLDQTSLNFGYFDGAIWLKFSIDSPQNRNAILEFKNPNLDDIRVFGRRDDNYKLIDKVGDSYPFSERKLKHRYLQIELEIPSDIIVRINNKGSKCYIPISIMSKESVAKRDYKIQFLWGMYFGLLLFIFFLTLTVYIMLRKKSTFFYLCYLFLTMIAQISYSGLGKQYFWSDSAFIANRSLPFTGVLASLFLVLFARYFLKTEKYTPRAHKYYSLVISVLIVVGIMSILPPNCSFHYASITLNSLLFLACIPIFSISYKAIKRGFKPAQFFFWSISILVFSVLIFVLHNFGWIPTNSFTSSSLQIGTAGEVIFLTLAIIQELKSLKEKASKTLLHVNSLKDRESHELAMKVESRTQKMLLNKMEIQEKNDKMVSSINYARYIQEILIPKKSEFIQPFADGFVLTQAKDIVSGDFYWCSTVKYNNNDLHVFCVGDCTGHGVPGALISVLGLRSLNNSLSEKNVTDAASTLDYLHKEFVQLFQGSGEEEYIRDGMDCSIGVFNPKTLTLQFAGAKNSLYVIRDNELMHFKGDKKEIGSSSGNSPFSQVEIQLQKGDRIYMFTDGYSDQFGGEFDKKMKPYKLKELMIENHLLPMEDQRTIYLDYFNFWKGDREQTDDMCIVGLEI